MNPSADNNSSLTEQLHLAAADTAMPDVDGLWVRGRRAHRRRQVATSAATGMGVIALLCAAYFAWPTAGVPTTTAGPADSAAPFDDTVPADAADPTGTDEIQPAAGTSHWHNAFGISACGVWLDPLMSTIDEYGIHSHQDGLIHIHPWDSRAAGENATMSLFFETMGIEVTDAGITLDTGEFLDASSCGDEPATMKMVNWQFPEFDPASNTISTTDFGAQRFMNDRAGWALIIGPEDAEVAIPPTTEMLAQVSPVISTEAPSSLPVPGEALREDFVGPNGDPPITLAPGSDPFVIEPGEFDQTVDSESPGG